MKFISVTRKTVIAFLVIGGIVMSFTVAIIDLVIFRYVERIETSRIMDGFESLELVIKREKEDLRRTSLDWAHWDDTYAYMQGKNIAEYEENNLQESTLRQLDLNVVVFINTENNIVYSLTNLDDKTKNVLLDNLLINHTSLLCFTNNNEVHTGIFSVKGKLVILSVVPITTTNEQAPYNGVLLMGRIMDESFGEYINSISKANIEMTEIDPKGNLGGMNSTEKTEGYITAYRRWKDINGEERLKVSLAMPRNDYHLGQYYRKVFLITFSVVIICILFISIGILHKYMLKRLITIHEFIKMITKTRDTSGRLYFSGNDEITDIAHSMNEMLAELATSNQKNKKIDERIQTLLEATDDGFADYNLKTKELYISPKWSRFSEVETKTPGFDPLREYLKRIQPEFLPTFKAKGYALIYGKADYDEVEYKILGADGEVVWVLHKSKVVERDVEGKAQRIISIFLNITGRKKYEEKIVKLSYCDNLTGLWNRAYMENKFMEFDNWTDVEYSIIMGDVNGLKIINDTFGHKEGDRLIQKIGQILHNVCGETEIVARWGGDEFIILSVNQEKDYLITLRETIKEECEKVVDFGFKVSIALGIADKREQADIETVMNLAEERMYRSKLTEVKSSRNATIASLLQTLYEKNSETEEHTQRLKFLALKLGKRLKLSQDELNKLELLSLLHDIGKTGIPEHILLKQGKLTNEEWTIIQRHAEIGFRIAKATHGLEHVAKEILCHHERFNGTGYPQALKGEEIPALSRIIAILDSFDVMTHERSYKAAFSVDYAIEELKRCSGTQFDPMLVTEFLGFLQDESIVPVKEKENNL